LIKNNALPTPDRHQLQGIRATSYKGDSPCQGKTPIFRPQGSKTPEPIDIKLDRGDYVGDLTPHVNFGISALKGGGAEDA